MNKMKKMMIWVCNRSTFLYTINIFSDTINRFSTTNATNLITLHIYNLQILILLHQEKLQEVVQDQQINNVNNVKKK